jgi:hypothetical protein
MADGIRCLSSSAPISDTSMITIKPTCLALQEFAKKYGAKKKKPLKIRGLISSVC